MGYEFPAAGDISATGGAETNAVKKVVFEDFLAAAKQLLGGSAEGALTIASGSITPAASGRFTVDTEAAAATDDLANILQTNMESGRLILLRNASDSRIVTVKHAAGGAGQIHLVDELDLPLRDLDEFLILGSNGTDWIEVLRSYRNRIERVIAITEVAASPKVLVPGDSGSYLLSDTGAAARNYATLPAATAGLRFRFGCDSAQGLRLTAAGTDRIQRLTTTSGAGGYYETPAEDGFQGEVVCWKATQWVIANEWGTGAGAVT